MGKRVDLVYPVGTGSYWGNNELRYSLRSIEKHATDYRNVYIIGELPDWCINVRHLFIHDEAMKTKNIMKKLLLACNIPHVSDPFLYMNDDHFFLKDVELSAYPNYVSDDKLAKILTSEVGPYTDLTASSKDLIEGLTGRFRYYDVHAPMLIYKSMFIEAIENVDWDNTGTPHGCLIKSLYGSYWDLDYLLFDDIKIGSPVSYAKLEELNSGRDIFSISDAVINYEFVSYMNTMYPLKSIYEQ